jgi:prepilin-type N-terminal cleavage/methylation domain-containing protein
MNNILTALKSIKNNSSGFTMIELLVVIAVIGVLAVAVLSSINPIEQINKGRDTRTRSDAAQLINAVDRFFAIHEVYPWNLDSEDGTYEAAEEEYITEFEQAEAAGEAAWGWLDRLVSTAEVKEGFTNRLVNDDSLYIYKSDEANATMYVCFEPTSQAFTLDAERNCTDGTTPADLEIAGRSACDEEGINLICLP